MSYPEVKRKEKLIDVKTSFPEIKFLPFKHVHGHRSRLEEGGGRGGRGVYLAKETLDESPNIGLRHDKTTRN